MVERRSEKPCVPSSILGPGIFIEISLQIGYHFSVKNYFDFPKLLRPSYLFEKAPPSNFKFLWPTLIFFTLMFLTGIILPKFLTKKKENPIFQKLAKKLSTPLIVYSLLGLLLLFFRNQAIPYLSARLLLFLLFFAFLVWLISFLLYLAFDFQKEKLIYQKKAELEKYLPKPKRKG